MLNIICLINKNLSDQSCEQVPKAAPEQHGGDEVGGGEETRGDDPENLLMTLSEDKMLEEVIKARNF